MDMLFAIGKNLSQTLTFSARKLYFGKKHAHVTNPLKTPGATYTPPNAERYFFELNFHLHNRKIHTRAQTSKIQNHAKPPIQTQNNDNNYFKLHFQKLS